MNSARIFLLVMLGIIITASIVSFRYLSKPEITTATGNVAGMPDPSYEANENTAPRDSSTHKQIAQPKDAEVAKANQNCISLEEFERSDKEWRASLGALPDDINESAEFQQLTYSDNAQLESMAKEGYTNAMVVLSDRLLFSENREQIEQGREWAYKAALHGSVQSLINLSASYLDDVERIIQSQNQEEEAHTASEQAREAAKQEAMDKYKSTLDLLVYIAPGMASTVDYVKPLENGNIDVAREEKTTALINDFESQREQLGLEKLVVTAPNIFNDPNIPICEYIEETE